MSAMPFEQLEIVYERLADAIDRAGNDNETLFLTKLVLLLAQRQENAVVVAEIIEAALLDLSERAG